MVTGDPPPEGAGVSLKSADAEPGPDRNPMSMACVNGEIIYNSIDPLYEFHFYRAVYVSSVSVSSFKGKASNTSGFNLYWSFRLMDVLRIGNRSATDADCSSLTSPP